MNRSYERASTVLTSNKVSEEWGEIFGNEVMATALLNRLLHRCHVLDIKDRSYRLRDLERLIQDGEPSAPKTRR